MLTLALREGLRNVRRHRALSLVLAGSIGLGLVLAAFLVVLGQTVTVQLAAWENRVEMVAFIPPDTSPEHRADIAAALEALPEVAAVSYSSPEDGWRELIRDVGAPEDLTSAGEVGLVPGAFTLRLRPGMLGTADLERLALRCRAIPGVAEVEYAADLLARYAALRRDVRRALAVGLLLLVFLLAGLSTATLRLGLGARQAEWRGWVWEGASPAFLSTVCATEAGLQGLLGSVWALSLCVLGEQVAAVRWGVNLPRHWPLFGVLFVLGPACGILASLLSARRLLRALHVGLAVLAIAGARGRPAGASDEAATVQGPGPPVTTAEFDAERAERELARLREQRELAQREADRLSGKSRGLLREIEQLGVIQDTLQGQMEDLKQDSAELAEEIAAFEGEIGITEHQHRALGARIVRLSRILKRAPEPTALAVLLADQPQGQAIRLRKTRDALLHHRLEAFAALERAQRELRRQRQALREAVAARAALAVSLEGNLRVQRAATAERRTLLAAVQDEQALAAATVAEFEASMEQLTDLLARLSVGTTPEVAHYGPVPFPDLRGILPWPIEPGTIARGYGRQVAPVFLTVTRHDGWLLAPPEAGAAVRAVHDGVVRYAEWLHGYGRLLVLDHGGGFQTLYGHCARIFAAPGQVVRAGEVVATVGTTGPLAGPALYFAVRVQGRAEDPAGWLAAQKG